MVIQISVMAMEVAKSKQVYYILEIKMTGVVDEQDAKGEV